MSSLAGQESALAADHIAYQPVQPDPFGVVQLDPVPAERVGGNARQKGSDEDPDVAPEAIDPDRLGTLQRRDRVGDGRDERGVDESRSDAEDDGDYVRPSSGAEQALLELRSENDRLRMVEEMFRTAIKRLEYAEEAAERAQTNGSVPH